MITKELEKTLTDAVDEAARRQHEYVTLEHLLLALLGNRIARETIYHCGGDLDLLKKEIEEFFAANMETFPNKQGELPEQTVMFQRVQH